MAALWFGGSLTPSLYPRPWVAQGVLSGLAVGIGYGFGCAVGGLGRRFGVGGSAVVRAWAGMAAGGLAVAVLVAALVANYRWQLDVRALMGMQGSATAYLLMTLPLAAVTGYAAVAVGRAVRAGHRTYSRALSRAFTPPVRTVVRLMVPVLVAAVVLDGLVAGPVSSRVRDSLAAADAATDPGVTRPSSALRSGGPGSLIPWDTLGRMGRRFVAGGPDAVELARFNAAPAQSPIRVYVGLGAADTDRERAALAVAELERTGGFDREVLVVITPTGTGSVNRFAVDPLEYMHNGDTAAVAMQYSYDPSWLRMLGNQDRAKDSARHLFEAVVARVRTLPAGSRPRVFLYGESLGSFGSESLFDDVTDVRTPVEGVLWVGPPRANRIWHRLTVERDAGSPVWQPVYRRGRTVRFATGGAELAHPSGPWGPPRIAFLQHASDPVTWWSADLLLRRPEWLDEPRGADISDRMPYLPVVTFGQIAIDMALGANAPLGHGHMYGPEHTEAWALMAPPDRWHSEGADRLVALLTP
ncbi:MAG: alpha/beta-hydrolase family protein [Jiangellaceae bacterium]|nr:alpha/beta-hydrolase family protein [Jiangellaceae bacterium]